MDRPLPALLLAVLLIAAGCVGVETGPAPASPTPAGESRTATVTTVVDGDTVDVRFADGSTDRVRLLGVDAPEVGGGTDPREFEGVPDTDDGRRCLADAGERASSFARAHLAGATVEVVTDPLADRRGDFGRLLAYLVLRNGTDLNYRLVETGHARVYDSTFGRADRFYAAESTAQAERRGLWRCREPEAALGTTDSPLRVEAVHADAAGDDRTNLEDEYVTFRNAGETSLDVGGWTVSDEAGHRYVVPDGVSLPPDATMTLHTGSGTDSTTHRYWGETEPVWNNDADTVVVRNATGAVVLEYAY